MDVTTIVGPLLACVLTGWLPAFVGLPLSRSCDRPSIVAVLGGETPELEISGVDPQSRSEIESRVRRRARSVLWNEVLIH